MWKAVAQKFLGAKPAVHETIAFVLVVLPITHGCHTPERLPPAPTVQPLATGDAVRRKEETSAEGGRRSRKPTTFLRCVDQGPWECTLQAAVATYKDDKGVSVSLVAAVHSADPERFLVLQERLATYQLVLYEGWKKKPEARGDRLASEPALLDFTMKASGFIETLFVAFLGFHHVGQWSGAVDYTAETFVNADMTFAEFAALSDERSETRKQFEAGFRLIRPYLVSALIRAIPLSREDFLWLLRLPRDWHQAGRYIYAQETCNANNLLGAYNGRPEVRQNITIHERNALVEEVLFREIGEEKTTAAVYYGAVHMPDFERRLLARGFKKTHVEWLDCWDVGRVK